MGHLESIWTHLIIGYNMSDEKKTNPLAAILANKKAKQQNNNSFQNGKGGKVPKPSKGFGGPAMVRRSGRGG